MAEVATRRWTLDEFLAFDDGTDRRFELHDGDLVATAPGSRAHVILCGRLARIIGNGLRPGCEVATEAGIVTRNRQSWYKAGLAVTCTGGQAGDPWLSDPVVLVEVLSPSTAMLDRGRKLRDYQEIGSLQDILLVSGFERRVEHWRRSEGAWVARVYVESQTLPLEAFPITLDLGLLYDGILPAAGSG
jgi:Uma2 family endonuclease